MAASLEIAPRDSILFDLDGTLWDITSLAARARNSAMKRLGIDHPGFTKEDIAKYIGLPVDEIYAKVFPHLPKETAMQLRLETGKEIASRLPTEGADIYPGVREGLEELKRRHRLFIVSNCATGYIENFLNWSKLGRLFDGHECYGNTLQPKAFNIAAVVTRHELKAPLYVGDTDGDQRAAVGAKVPYVHVTYGFGRPCEPCTCYASFPDLVSSLLSLEKSQ